MPRSLVTMHIFKCFIQKLVPISNLHQCDFLILRYISLILFKTLVKKKALTLACADIHQMYAVGNSVDKAQWRNGTQCMRGLFGQAHNAVFGDGNNIHAVRKFVVIDVTVYVVGEELLGVLVFDGQDRY